MTEPVADNGPVVHLTQDQTDALKWGVGSGWTGKFLDPAQRDQAIADLYRAIEPWAFRDQLVDQVTDGIMRRSRELRSSARVDANFAHHISEIAVDVIVGAVGVGAHGGDPPHFASGASIPPAPAPPGTVSSGARGPFEGGGAPGRTRLTLDEFDGNQPPGAFLVQWAQDLNITPEQAAERLDTDLDTYRELCDGTEPITSRWASRLADGTGIYTTNIWLMLERIHRAKLVAQAGRRDLESP